MGLVTIPFWQALLLVTCPLAACYDRCPQLGCDAASRFAQGGINLITENVASLIWKTESSVPMPLEIETAGCVGDQSHLVCPTRYESQLNSSYSIYSTRTGGKIELEEATLIQNIWAANINMNSNIFTCNGQYAQLVDMSLAQAETLELPVSLPNNAFSAVYLEDLRYHVVFGNGTSDVLVFHVKKESEPMSFLHIIAHFNVTDKSGDSLCSWLFVSQPAQNGNRVYIYAISSFDGDEGLVAIDFMDTSPYYKLAWVLDVTNSSYYSYNKRPKDDICSYRPHYPYAGSPLDMMLQLSTDSSQNVFMASVSGLVVFKDLGSYGLLDKSTPFAAGCMTKLSEESYTWILATGKPSTHHYLVGFSPNLNTSKVIDMKTLLNAEDLNITTRLHSVWGSNSKQQVLIFGVSMIKSAVKTTTCTSLPCDKSAALDRFTSQLLAIQPMKCNEKHLELVWSADVPGGYYITGAIIVIKQRIIVRLKHHLDGTSMIAAFGKPTL